MKVAGSRLPRFHRSTGTESFRGRFLALRDLPHVPHILRHEKRPLRRIARNHAIMSVEPRGTKRTGETVETHAVGERRPLVPRYRRFPVPRQAGASRGGTPWVANSRQVAALFQKGLQREGLDGEHVPRGKCDGGRNRGDAECVGENDGGAEETRGEGDGGRSWQHVISRGDDGEMAGRDLWCFCLESPRGCDVCERSIIEAKGVSSRGSATGGVVELAVGARGGQGVEKRGSVG